MSELENVKKTIGELVSKYFEVVKIDDDHEAVKYVSDGDMILVSRKKLRRLMISYLDRLERQGIVLNMLIDKLTDVAKDYAKKDNEGLDNVFAEAAVDNARWDYFFDLVDKRRIMDHIISEEKSRKIDTETC